MFVTVIDVVFCSNNYNADFATGTTLLNTSMRYEANLPLNMYEQCSRNNAMFVYATGGH